MSSPMNRPVTVDGTTKTLYIFLTIILIILFTTLLSIGLIEPDKLKPLPISNKKLSKDDLTLLLEITVPIVTVLTAIIWGYGNFYAPSMSKIINIFLAVSLLIVFIVLLTIGLTNPILLKPKGIKRLKPLKSEQLKWFAIFTPVFISGILFGIYYAKDEITKRFSSSASDISAYFEYFMKIIKDKLGVNDTNTDPGKSGSTLFEFYNMFENISDIDMKSMLEKCRNYMFLFLFVIVLSGVIFYSKNDPSFLIKMGGYMIYFLLPVIGFMLYSFVQGKNFNYVIPMLIIMCFLIIVATYVYISTSKYAFSMMNFFTQYLLIPLIILVGLSILYKIFFQYITQLNGWSKFIVEFIFYIPCLIIYFLQYLSQQYKVTPNIVFVLLILELIFILIYLCIPLMYKKLLSRNSNVILKEPVYLNRDLTIASSDISEFKNTGISGSDLGEVSYRTNYAISMWVLVNPRSVANASYKNETTIFDYSDNNETPSVKPRIAYKITETGENHIFYFSNVSSKSSYSVVLPTQKWNHFVFNYYDSNVDLFINGNLERTFEFSDSVPPPVYSPSDTISVGSFDGLDGAICNVAYFKNPLKRSDIANLFNVSYQMNPPL